MATKILKYTFAIFLILVLIVLLRAYLHQPDAYQAKISEPIIFDEAKSINNLSRSIQFETISHPDYEKFDYDEFQRFLAWLEEEYFHDGLTGAQKLTRESPVHGPTSCCECRTALKFKISLKLNTEKTYRHKECVALALSLPRRPWHVRSVSSTPPTWINRGHSSGQSSLRSSRRMVSSSSS